MWNKLNTHNGNISYNYNELKDSKFCFVFLNAWGGNSCYLDFKNIIDKISKKYSYLAIDYLGYGSSEMTDSERNLKNITEELLSVIKHLKIQNFIIFCHSMGGLYGLNILKKYNNYIKGFIAIEPTTAEIKEKHPEEIQHVKEAALRVQGLRSKGKIDEWLKDCEFNPYLNNVEKNIAIEQEKEKALNKNLIEEMENSLQSALAVKDFTIPKHIPTLIFSGRFRESDLIKSNFISQNSNSKFIVSDLSHYAHWFNEDFILTNTKEFLRNLN